MKMWLTILRSHIRPVHIYGHGLKSWVLVTSFRRLGKTEEEWSGRSNNVPGSFQVLYRHSLIYSSVRVTLTDEEPQVQRSKAV